MIEIRSKIEEAWSNRELLKQPGHVAAIEEVVQMLDSGQIRVAEHTDRGWIVNDWVKKAITLYFPVHNSRAYQSGIFEYYDKVPLKTGFESAGVRVVPPATIRYGSFVEKGAVVMPSYINIGAYVGAGSMIDTWATVGSCAQVGRNVHISGGVGLGGVLEPPQASPTIIEDNAFIGSRCIIVEGVRIEREAVLGANVVLTQSTRIIDVTGSEPVYYKGCVPPGSVVIPGSYTKSFPAGDFQVACALIIGQRKESTDKKTSLNNALRDYDVSV